MALELVTHGLLGDQNKLLLGESFTFDPGVANGSEGTSRLLRVGPSVAITARAQYAQQQAIVAVNSVPTSRPALGLLLQSVARVKLQFHSGRSMFGVVQDALPPPPISPHIGSLLTPEIWLDADSNVFTIPASVAFELSFYHYASSILPFTAGQPLGAAYRVNSGYSYGTPKSQLATYTDNTMRFQPSDPAQISALWARPQFANSLRLNFATLFSTSLLGGYALIIFIDGFGNRCKTCHITFPFSGDSPLITWPNGANYVYVQVDTVTVPGPGSTLEITPLNYLSL
jgi:hypothetical protein